MTPQRARELLCITLGAVVAVLLLLLGLLVYGLVHPARHPVLLVLLGIVFGPALLAIFLRKTSFRGMLEPVRDLVSG